MDQSSIKALSKWQEEIGLSRITNIDDSEVNKILDKSSTALLWTEPRDLQFYLIVLARYRMFLIKEIGVLKSKIDYYVGKLETQISGSASRQNAPTKEERRALANQNDPKVEEITNKLELLQIKYTQLKDMPNGLQEFINKIDRLEHRKTQEMEAEGKLKD